MGASGNVLGIGWAIGFPIVIRSSCVVYGWRVAEVGRLLIKSR